MPNEENFPKLGPIVIGTADMERAKKFYIAVFGITILNDESSHHVNARAVDGTHIELEGDSPHRFPDWAKHNVGTYKNSEFVVKDIHAFMETVEQNGERVVTNPTPRPWGGYGAEIADPDGNIFLISER